MAFSFKRSITIDHTKCGSGTSTNFPVLFAGTYTYLKTVANGGQVQHGSGYDIAFYADSSLTTLLDFERVSWSASTGTCEFWVKVPSVSHSADTVIWLAYGDPSISSDLADATNVWDSNFKAVWHLSNTNDSTSNANHGTANGATPAAGKCGDGYSFDKVDDYISVAAASSINNISPMTISAWIKPISDGELNGYIVDKSANDTSGFRFRVQNLGGGVNNQVGFRSDATSDVLRYTESNFTTFNVWQLVCVTWDGSVTASNIHIYRNGVEASSYFTSTNGSGSRVSDSSNTLIIGNRADTTATFDGTIDEVRLSDTIRSTDWLVTEYNNQNDPASFYSIGAAIGGPGMIGFFNLPVLM